MSVPPVRRDTSAPIENKADDIILDLYSDESMPIWTALETGEEPIPQLLFKAESARHNLEVSLAAAKKNEDPTQNTIISENLVKTQDAAQKVLKELRKTMRTIKPDSDEYKQLMNLKHKLTLLTHTEVSTVATASKVLAANKGSALRGAFKLLAVGGITALLISPFSFLAIPALLGVTAGLLATRKTSILTGMKNPLKDLVSSTDDVRALGKMLFSSVKSILPKEKEKPIVDAPVRKVHFNPSVEVHPFQKDKPD